MEECRHHLIHNAAPLRVDPTRTTLIRRRFMADMSVRFGKLARAIWDFIESKDALGLAERPRPSLLSSRPLPIDSRGDSGAGITFLARVQPREFEFRTSSGKLEGFNEWLGQQVREDILSVPSGQDPSTPWTSKYIDSAYRRGQLNAYIATRQETGLDRGQEEFLRSSFAAPEATGKIRLLATRSFESLKGITASMAADMNRILAQGIADGKGPKTLAKELVTKVGLTKSRSMLIARTESIYAHAEGQLDSFADLGVDELGVLAEWSTAGDDRVCAQCLAMEEKTFSIKEARGLIPLHPNCRCSWIPAIPKEKVKKKPARKVRRSSKEKKKQEVIEARLPEIDGHSIVSVIRAAGQHGWSFEQTRDLLAAVGHTPNPATIRIQLRAGKLGKGSIAPTSILDKLRAGTITPPPITPPPITPPPITPPPKVIPPTPIVDVPEVAPALTPVTETLEEKIQKILAGKKPMMVESYEKRIAEYVPASVYAETKEALTKRYQGYIDMEYRNAFHQALKESRPGERSSSKLMYGSALEKTKTKAFREIKAAETWIQDVVPKKRLDEVGSSVVTVQNGRANYKRWEKRITVDPHGDVGTVVHEFGHHLQNDTKLFRSEQRFLLSRMDPTKVDANGSPKLIKLYGRKDELAFYTDFAAKGGDDYAAKVYDYIDYGSNYGMGTIELTEDHFLKWRSGEISSMGLERMYRNPAEFYRNDPDYFKWVADNMLREP